MKRGVGRIIFFFLSIICVFLLLLTTTVIIMPSCILCVLHRKSSWYFLPCLKANKSRAWYPARSISMYVCMVIKYYSRVWINRVRLTILLVVSWTGKNNIPLSPCVPENLVSRDGFSRPVPRQPAHLSILRLNLVLIYGIPPEFRGGVHLWNRHTPSGQSRDYRVTQLRTDGVHCRESAGTGPVNIKVVPNECCLGRSPCTN